MINVQQIFDIIETYRFNKGWLKKIFRIDHPAISATEGYLRALKKKTKFDSLSIQALLSINGFFCQDFPIKSSQVIFDAWISINYQHFFRLKSENIGNSMLKPSGQQNELYYWGVSQLILRNKLTESNFISLSNLWVEEILSPDRFEAILSSANSYFLVKALIHLKRGNSLTPQNTSFIFSYKTQLTWLLASILVYLDQMQLNTLENRERLRLSEDHLIPLLHATKLLVKAECLTQENFELIQATEKKDWLYALWNMPVDLINTDVWQSLVNLSITSNKNEFKKDIDAYVGILKSIKRNEIARNDSKSEINGRYSGFFSHSHESLNYLNEHSDVEVSWLRSQTH